MPAKRCPWDLRLAQRRWKEIDAMLLAGETVTTALIRERWNVSRATAKRDMQTVTKYRMLP